MIAVTAKPVRSQRGFTLIEILVAAAILALVAVALGVAMRSLAMSETRIDERIAADEELRSATALLRTTLGRISPGRHSPAAAGNAQIVFRGEQSELEWIGVMPAHHGAGGLYRFHLRLQPPAAERPGQLVLSFAPLWGEEVPPEGDAVESRVLVSGISDLVLRYMDENNGNETWDTAWQVNDRLPARIAIDLALDGRSWPEIVISPVFTAASGRGPARGSSGITIGP